MSKTNTAWTKILKKLPITKAVQAGYGYLISADEIKNISGREPRLMAKMDSSCNVPKVFKENNLSILAVKNGLYKITDENPYIEVPSLSHKKMYNLKKIKTLLDLDTDNNKLTETQVLDLAFNNNILSDCFGESVQLGFRGRKRSSFDFALGKSEFNVVGTQVEVDGSYFSPTTINVVEVKTGKVTDTTIRQLLYSKRMLENMVSHKAPVHAWLLVYNDNYFNFHKFSNKNGEYSFDYTNSKRYVLK